MATRKTMTKNPIMIITAEIASIPDLPGITLTAFGHSPLSVA
jgi:hypothetical protein